MILNFLKLLSEKHSVHHIGECFKTYEKLYNEDNSIKIVNVTNSKAYRQAFGRKTIAET